MKTRVQASVGIKNDTGDLHFGHIEWVDQDTLQLLSPGALKAGRRCELKIEMTNTGEWFFTDAMVLRSATDPSDSMTRGICRMLDLSQTDRARLDAFVQASVNSRPRPENRVSTNLYAVGETTPSSAQGTVPLRDPQMALSEDGRRITVRWHDPRAFRRDWAIHLSQGRLPAPGTPPRRAAFMLCLITPEGFVATFPAEVGDTAGNGWQARFLIPMGPRKRMSELAGHTEDRVAIER